MAISRCVPLPTITGPSHSSASVWTTVAGRRSKGQPGTCCRLRALANQRPLHSLPSYSWPMALRETEGSLRAYFLLAGVVSVLMGLRDVSELARLAEIDGLELPFDWLIGLYVPLVTRFVLGVGFIAAGVMLKSALPRGARWIRTLLVISGAMLFVNGALVASVFGTTVGRSGIVGAVIGLLITIYLHRSVTRLAQEAAAREGIPPPPPTAKVV